LLWAETKVKKKNLNLQQNNTVFVPSPKVRLIKGFKTQDLTNDVNNITNHIPNKNIRGQTDTSTNISARSTHLTAEWALSKDCVETLLTCWHRSHPLKAKQNKSLQ
jgi:hypothetical protein